MNNCISIIGSGLIGQQWAMLFTSYKYNVFIYDIIEDQIKSSQLAIKNELEKYSIAQISRSDENTELQLKRILFTTSYEDLPKNSSFVIECASENIDVKRNVFKIIDNYFDEKTIRMSSSSYLPISKYTDTLTNKSKCIITHPVNPPYFLRLVEIVPAPYTDIDTISKTKALMDNISQISIIFKKEIPGFAVNRIQSAVYNSIFKLINDDVIDISDIDKLITEGLGPRWAFYGPLQVAVLNGPGIDNYCKKYLKSMDEINKQQNYDPQHNLDVIEKMLNGFKTADNNDDLKTLNDNRNFNLGKLLKIKLNKID